MAVFANEGSNQMRTTDQATHLVTVSDSLSEYCPDGIGSYWASTICASKILQFLHVYMMKRNGTSRLGISRDI